MMSEVDGVLHTASRRSLQCDTSVVRPQLFLSRFAIFWPPGVRPERPARHSRDQCDGVIKMRARDTVYTPPGEEHWHGGTADNMMCHLAMIEGTESGDGSTWLEPVTDEQYAAANQA
jgi:hypothetical protein